MPTVNAAKIKIRRGKNIDRNKVVLEEGELGYTIDTKRTFIGDGSTYGGNVLGTKNFNVGTRAGSTGAITGDFVFDNNFFYCLTGTNYETLSGWLNLAPRTDDTTIRYDSNNRLYVVPGSLTLGTVGNGLALDGSNVPYLNLNSDAQTDAFFSFNGTALKVEKLTNISHGGLGYQDTDTSTQHHANATTTTPGFISDTAFSKLCASPFPAADATDGNTIVNAINTYATTGINASRITGTITAGNANNTNTISYINGASENLTLSADSLLTPYSFLNREDFPGTVFDTAVPTSYITNQGAFANFIIGSFAASAPSTGNYQDKAFQLPAGDGTVYSIFIQNPSDDTNLDAYKAANKNVSVISCDYNASSSILQTNVVNAINSAETTDRDTAFDAWVDSNNIYVQSLVRGFTPTYNSTFAQGYGGTQIADGSVTYANGNTYASKSGSGPSAADSSSGTIPSSLYGWVCLNTTSQTLSGRGKLSVHTVASLPAKASISNGDYFLIYDTNYNRTCVYYDTDGSATEPSIGNSPLHRGFKTNFVKIDISGDTTSDDVATRTTNTLNSDGYFSSVYSAGFSTPTITFTSVDVGYTDGVVNRVGVGLTSGTFTPNAEEGSPNVRALNGAFFNAFKVTTPATAPQDEIVIPGKAQQTLIDDNSTTVNVQSILKFR
jgi:hypothetical protein